MGTKQVADLKAYVTDGQLERRVAAPFYSDSMDMDLVIEAQDALMANLTLKEIMKVFREITYWAVRPESKIYKDKEYSELCREQINMFQNQIRARADLFTQAMVYKREFQIDYLRDYEDARVYLAKIKKLEQRIEELEEELQNAE